MSKTYSSVFKTQIIADSELSKLQMSNIRLELIAFISNPDTSEPFLFSDPQMLLEKFLRLLQDEFCTNQDYKEFLEFYTQKFISTNL